jgi:hypothetical protein
LLSGVKRNVTQEPEISFGNRSNAHSSILNSTVRQSRLIGAKTSQHDILRFRDNVDLRNDSPSGGVCAWAPRRGFLSVANQRQIWHCSTPAKSPDKIAPAEAF